MTCVGGGQHEGACIYADDWYHIVLDGTVDLSQEEMRAAAERVFELIAAGETSPDTMLRVMRELTGLNMVSFEFLGEHG